MIYYDQVLLDTPSLLIRYSSPHKLVQAQWHGCFDAVSARQQCEQLLRVLPVGRPVQRLINDSSEVFGEWWAAADWIGRELVPALAAHGVRAVAWINAMDWPSRDAIASAIALAQELPIRAFDFDEAEAAQTWVLTAVV